MKHSPGFTLIEVLVTITLLAVGIVTALGIVRASAGRVEVTAQHEQASQIAETLLTEIRLGLCGPGDSGEVGGYSWDIVAEGPCWTMEDVRPAAPGSSSAEVQSDCAVQPVELTVSWGDEDTSHIRVETLAPVDAQQAGE